MRKGKIGLIGLTLELYKNKIPSLIPKLEKFSKELNYTISKTIETINYPIAWNKKKYLKDYVCLKKKKLME